MRNIPHPSPVRSAEVAPPAPLPPAPASPARVTVSEIAGITFEGVAFDSRNHHLVVADQVNGPGSRWPDASAAAQAVGGLAAINASFFTPEGAPLGLVVSAGKISGSWNTASSLGSGAWCETPTAHPSIVRREKLGRTGAAAMREVIQAGPLLVENSQAVSGLDATKSSIRTFVFWDGGKRWWIGRASACTLHALSQALASGRPADWPVRHALNLDGGRSSDLWISSAVSGGPLLRRTPWNRPVRNFLVLVPG